MIYTVTLNPALDRFIVVEQLLTEDTTRILSETAYAAGKGINVSRVIRELGGHIVALGLVGGYEGPTGRIAYQCGCNERFYKDFR